MIECVNFSVLAAEMIGLDSSQLLYCFAAFS